MMKTQRPSVKMKTYEQASRVLNEYEETRPHLQSLVEKFIPDGTLNRRHADFQYLKHCGRTIKGVAQKILESSNLIKKIKKLSQIGETEKELLEERICIQMDSLSGNYLLYLIRQYEKTKA
ncbi:MAG: hypothetical protein V1889_00900 [archaeon]